MLTRYFPKVSHKARQDQLKMEVRGGPLFLGLPGDTKATWEVADRLVQAFKQDGGFYGLMSRHIETPRTRTQSEAIDSVMQVGLASHASEALAVLEKLDGQPYWHSDHSRFRIDSSADPVNPKNSTYTLRTKCLFQYSHGDCDIVLRV